MPAWYGAKKWAGVTLWYCSTRPCGSAAKASVITDAMRATIGRESEPVTYEIDNLGCRQFARAVGYTNPIYYDAAHAKSKGYRGLAAPAGFLGHPIFDPTKPPRIPEAFRVWRGDARAYFDRGDQRMGSG